MCLLVSLVSDKCLSQQFMPLGLCIEQFFLPFHIIQQKLLLNNQFYIRHHILTGNKTKTTKCILYIYCPQQNFGCTFFMNLLTLTHMVLVRGRTE